MVAIKDFGMPSCCENCNMYDPSESDYCSITGSWVTGFEGRRLSDCPLVEIEERKIEKLEQIGQIVDKWNNDASRSFEDMCKINGILKE